MTQTERVLAASRSYRGVCAVDFQLPQTIDGGKPILRVAARIFDLEAQGYTFERLPNRHGCAVYRLVSEAPSVSPRSTPPGRETTRRDSPVTSQLRGRPSLRVGSAAQSLTAERLFEPEPRRPRKHYEAA